MKCENPAFNSSRRLNLSLICKDKCYIFWGEETEQRPFWQAVWSTAGLVKAWTGNISSATCCLQCGIGLLSSNLTGILKSCDSATFIFDSSSANFVLASSLTGRISSEAFEATFTFFLAGPLFRDWSGVIQSEPKVKLFNRCSYVLEIVEN